MSKPWGFCIGCILEWFKSNISAKNRTSVVEAIPKPFGARLTLRMRVGFGEALAGTGAFLFYGLTCRTRFLSALGHTPRDRAYR
jgi:hypothetical protein